MTPDLMEAGAQRLQEHTARMEAGKTESGGRAAAYGRTLKFGYRAHMIVRDTEAEARSAADRASRALACSVLSRLEVRSPVSWL